MSKELFVPSFASNDAHQESSMAAAASRHVAPPDGWVDAVMEQAQVYASAWALVGGRFDAGDALADAEQAKAELRAMITAHLTYGAE